MSARAPLSSREVRAKAAIVIMKLIAMHSPIGLQVVAEVDLLRWRRAVFRLVLGVLDRAPARIVIAIPGQVCVVVPRVVLLGIVPPRVLIVMAA